MIRRPSEKALWCIATLAGALALLLSTATDAIQTSDSGELVAAACNGGVPHAPGYPLYTLLGGWLCDLPLSTPAGRVTFLSVIAGALSVMMLLLVVRALTGERVAAALAAGALATGWLVWRYSSLAEVFALNNALTLGLILCAVKTSSANDAQTHLKWSFVTAVIGGLGISHHHTIVFVAPLAAAAVLVPLRGGRALALRLAVVLLGLAIGLLPHLYLYTADPLIRPRWGDTSTLEGLWHHFLRKDYGTLSLTIQEAGNPWTVLVAFVTDLPMQLGGPLVLLVPLGWGALLARAAGKTVPVLGRVRRDMAALLATAVLLAGPAFLLLIRIEPTGAARQHVERFFLQAIVLCAICFGIGLAVSATYLRSRPLRVRKAATAMVVANLLVVLVLNYRRADVSENYVVEDYALNLLRSVEDGALVLGTDDARFFSVIYVQTTLGVRPKVQYVNPAMLLYPWYVAQEKRRNPLFPYEFQDKRANTLPLIEKSLLQGTPVYLGNAYSETIKQLSNIYPVGPLRKVFVPGNGPPPPKTLALFNATLYDTFVFRGERPDAEIDPWSASMLAPYAETWRVLEGALRNAGETALANDALERVKDYSAL